MKIKSHVLTGIGYVIATEAFEPFAVAAVSLGSMLPDVIDSMLAFGNESVFRKIHRKITHWWVLYLFPLVLFVLSGMGNQIFYYFCIGGLLHVFCDSLTKSGVPFVNPFRAGHGLRVIKTGSIEEYLILALIISSFFLCSYIAPIPAWFIFSFILFLSLFSYKKKDIKPKHTELIEIPLSELSTMWTGKHIIKGEQTESEHTNVIFNKEELTAFYSKHVEQLPESARGVIEQILKMLDEKGNCPSVVKRSSELNEYQEPNTFTTLAKVPLYLHSLHVAEEILKLVDKPGAYGGQLIMAALGHDLGKIEGFDRVIYSMGDHPRISVVVLNGVAGFSKLKYRTDVESAILSHHRTGGGDLADKLREADRNARRKELADGLIDLDAGDYYEQQGTNLFTYPKETEAEKKPSETTDLEWLNIDEFIAELDNKINRLNGTRFEAFSMKDGHIYFQTDVFWKVIKMLARRHGKNEILLADADQQQRRNYIYTITEILREKRFIADGIIKQGYFTAPFTVEYRDGKSIKKAYYTPMVSEVFGDVSELESRKRGILQEIVSVSPKYGDE